MKIFIIIILLLTNLIFILYLNKKKIKKLFFPKKIQSVNISDLNKIFELNKIDNNLFGPKEETLIKSFCISPNNNIVGMTSNYEAWILSVLSKKSKNIFEFGTCSGKTTYLMALNSPSDSKITTITLKPNQKNYIKKQNLDNGISYRNILNESIYEKFLFSGSEEEKKIQVLFLDSTKLEISNHLDSYDLIFIDGGHTYSIVKNDSEKSFKMIKKNGYIFWHDYVPGKESAKDIVKYIHEVSKHKEILHIKNTSLCFFRK